VYITICMRQCIFGKDHKYIPSMTYSRRYRFLCTRKGQVINQRGMGTDGEMAKLTGCA